MSNITPYKRPGSLVNSFAPQTFSELNLFAQMVVKTSMCPKEYQQKPEEALAVMMYGAELGLAPLQALNSVKFISGKPSLYGDGLLAVCRKDYSWIDMKEEIINTNEKIKYQNKDMDNWAAKCTVSRKGQSPVVSIFKISDAVRASLWGKGGPWTTYPMRMLKMRARGFALRDAFADVLCGFITAEEAQDMPVVGEILSAPSQETLDMVYDAFEEEVKETIIEEMPTLDDTTVA